MNRLYILLAVMVVMVGLVLAGHEALAKVLTGTGGDDTLVGTVGNDHLDGRAGDDRLWGSSGGKDRRDKHHRRYEQRCQQQRKTLHHLLDSLT
jgi:hypothetical protein